jgi:hypothetical protein
MRELQQQSKSRRRRGANAAQSIGEGNWKEAAK